MRKALQSVAQEISASLVREIQDPPVTTRGTEVSIVDLLLQQLASALVSQLAEGSSSGGSSSEDLEARLQKLERKLGIMAGDDEDGDEDEIHGTASDFPNLKYAGSKYRNVESMLKYVEKADDKGGVKLMIMNFND